MLFFPAKLTGHLLLMLFVSLSAQQTRGKRHTVEVHNHTKNVVERVYMSASTEGNWGEDRLGVGTIRPDHYFPIEVPTGDYDFKIIDENKRKCTVMEEQITSDGKIEIYEDGNEMKCRRKDDID